MSACFLGLLVCCEQVGFCRLQLGDQFAAAGGADGAGDFGAEKAKNSRSCSFIRSHGGLPMTQSKPPPGAVEDGWGRPLASRAPADARRVGNQAVAADDVMRQVGQGSAAAGGANPQGQLGDLDGLLRQVHAVEVVGQDEVGDGVVERRAPSASSCTRRLSASGVYCSSRSS